MCFSHPITHGPSTILLRHIEKRHQMYLHQNKEGVLVEIRRIQFIKSQDTKNHCAEVYYQQSLYFKNQKNTEAQQISLENSIKMNPNKSDYYRDLGILLYRQNQLDVAKFQLENALDLNYADCESHFNLGKIMIQIAMAINRNVLRHPNWFINIGDGVVSNPPKPKPAVVIPIALPRNTLNQFATEGMAPPHITIGPIPANERPK